MGSLEWPFTHRNTTSPRLFTAVTNGSHRSRLATGFLALFNHPRAIHPSHQRSRKQFTTYVESLTISSGPSMASTAWRAAAISMRWLVLLLSAPFAHRPPGMAHAHPPGPRFPRQAPSV